jgi:hypothetical protein
VADFALLGGDAGSLNSSGKSRELDFVIRKMTLVTGARTGGGNNVAVVGSTALVVGVVVVVRGRHGKSLGGGGWFGLNCEKSIRLLYRQRFFYHPLDDIAMTSGVKTQPHILKPIILLQ